MAKHDRRRARARTGYTWLFAVVAAAGLVALVGGAVVPRTQSGVTGSSPGAGDAARITAPGEPSAVTPRGPRPDSAEDGGVQTPRDGDGTENEIADPDRDAGEGGALDPEWDRLPRTALPMARLLLRWRPDARYLFRHVRLNPADAYLPPADREVLAEMVRRYSGVMALAEQRQHEAIQREVGALVRAGKVTGSRPGNSRFRAAPLSVHSDDVVVTGSNRQRSRSTARTRISTRLRTAYYLDGDLFYRVPLSELPEVREAEQVLHALAQELLAAVTSYFEARALLPAAAAARLRRELSGSV